MNRGGEHVRRYFFDVVSKQELDTLRAVFDRVLENLTGEASLPLSAEPVGDSAGERR